MRLLVCSLLLLCFCVVVGCESASGPATPTTTVVPERPQGFGAPPPPGAGPAEPGNKAGASTMKVE
jgi:hypothetical protein